MATKKQIKKPKRDPRPLLYVILDCRGRYCDDFTTKSMARKELPYMNRAWTDDAPHRIAKVVPCD